MNMNNLSYCTRFLLLPYSKPFKLIFNESLVSQWFQHIKYNEDQATGSSNCLVNGKKQNRTHVDKGLSCDQSSEQIVS